MTAKTTEFEQLDRQLKKTIKKMKKWQKMMAGDEQPVSMHELDQLTALGQRYGELVSRMQALASAEGVTEEVAKDITNTG